MNWLDYLILIFAAIFAFEGLAQGFSRQAFGLASLIVGLFVAAWTYGMVAFYLIPYVASKMVADVLGFIIIFVVIQVLGGMAGGLLAKLFKWTGLGWLDRMLGLAFGVVKAGVVGVILVMVLSAFPIKPVPDSVAHSRYAPYLIDAAQAVTFLMPRELRKGFSETYDKVRELWKSGKLPEALEPDKS